MKKGDVMIAAGAERKHNGSSLVRKRKVLRCLFLTLKQPFFSKMLFCLRTLGILSEKVVPNLSEGLEWLMRAVYCNL